MDKNILHGVEVRAQDFRHRAWCMRTCGHLTCVCVYRTLSLCFGYARQPRSRSLLGGNCACWQAGGGNKKKPKPFIFPSGNPQLTDLTEELMNDPPPASMHLALYVVDRPSYSFILGPKMYCMQGFSTGVIGSVCS